jgi:hypothetical protein
VQSLSEHALLSLTYHDDPQVQAEALAERARRDGEAIDEAEAAIIRPPKPQRHTQCS